MTTNATTTEIALLGGTGEIGEALALRLGRDADYPLTIGSRDERKASEAAEQYRSRLRDRGVDPQLGAAENVDAAADADVVVLSVPPYYAEETIETIAPGLDDETILVSPAVGMQRDEDGLHYHPPSVGSVIEMIDETAPDDVPVVGAFTNLSGERLADLDVEIDTDTLLLGDDEGAKETVATVADSIRGLRPLDVGPLTNATEVEALTPLLINIAQYNDDMENVCVTFH
ncbi:NADPH-dependent F420 reductase [Halopiger aswanensis]|uniref:Reduced coenzyme F420:NADP oxidoreductase n=1 Tax=Halopiger aswanensis TaxID=148449 RepID=A0A3R7ECT5_9EURY|nr:NADPH-dependent F420 reductase [Halopiger aswanensis]RKD89223.1 reduced coenzyme F420:NADP oxidoreductase [Halopiger aswanensis]